MSSRNSKVEEPSRRRRNVRVDSDEDEPPKETKPTRARAPVKQAEPEPKEEVKPTRAKSAPKVEPTVEKPKVRTVSKTTETKSEAKAKGEAPKPTKEPKKEDKETKEKKKPTAEELKKKFLDDFPKLVKVCRQKSTFLKIWNSKNPLANGGMAKRLKDNQDKTGDDEIVYSLDLAITGSRGDFNQLFKEPIVQDVMDEYDLTAEIVIDNFITFSNYEERKDTEDVKHLRDVVTKQHTQLMDSLRLVEKHFVKSTPDKTLTKQQRMVANFDELIESGKVFDVSGWSAASNNGYKRIVRPSANSKKHCMTTYPICSSEEQRMKEFLEYLGLDSELTSEAFA